MSGPKKVDQDLHSLPQTNFHVTLAINMAVNYTIYSCVFTKDITNQNHLLIHTNSSDVLTASFFKTVTI